MTTTRVHGIRLDPRQQWAWKRLGQDAIRDLIAPPGICVQCGHRKAEVNTRNGWFCYPCQDDLDQLSLLPATRVEQLEKKNQELCAQLERLRSQIRQIEGGSVQPQEQQLSLFG